MPRPNRWKSWSSAEPLTTKGRRLEDLERDEQRKREEEYRAQSDILSMVDVLNHGRSKVVGKKFFLAHFGIHLKTPDDIILPAEGALIEFSIDTGISRQWHSLIQAGEIPLGTRSECVANAQKTHLIPLEDEDLYKNADGEMITPEDILDEIVGMLTKVKDFGTEPVFCFSSEKTNVELVLEVLYRRGQTFKNDLVLPKVYALEDLLYFFEKSIKKEVKERKMKKDLDDDKDFKYLASSSAALYKLQNANFANVAPCAFHDEHFKAEFCSLAIVRNRAFAILDRLCDVSISKLYSAFSWITRGMPSSILKRILI